jgi:hypothetical protein
MEEWERAYRVLMERRSGKIPLGFLGVRGRIILKGIFKKWDGRMGWTDVAQDRNRCWALVNAIINIWLP